MFLKDETREPAAKNIRVAYSGYLTDPYSSASEPITGAVRTGQRDQVR